MSKQKQTRKRKHTTTRYFDIEFEVDAPKTKFRPSEDAEDSKLSEMLFGGSSSFLKSLDEAERSEDVDSGVAEGSSTDSDESEPKAAWYDEDDVGIDVGQALDSQKRKLPSGGLNSRDNKYSELLKHKFQSIVGRPKWANINKSKSDRESDEELLQTCGFIAKTPTAHILPNLLEFKKVKDLNSATYSEGPLINSIEFHPNSTVALVAGNKGIATLYTVDGKQNSKLHSIAFEQFPILCAKFVKTGNEAVLGSRLPYIQSYDLLAAKSVRYKLPPGMTQCKKFVVSPDDKFMAVAGKWGEVHIISTVSKERIFMLKQDSEVTALEYNPKGNLLFGHSDTGEITVWDMNMQRVKHKFADEGCLQGTALSVSSSNQFLAAGSAQGVVNLYGMEDVLKNKLPKPRKGILNLTTQITGLKFNHTSEVLAFTSVDIKNSIRLFHVGSGTVYSNFPPFDSKLGNLNCINFSPNSGFLALGNRKSLVSLYRLKHFKNY
ncbi:U3 small nucleolar RNA-associated protein 18 homolog [Cylas formicarius]|uniref:U3 small nucleolar RNA-associated protein 18 homolog n=1 Tax=Cylas formicarius TaxID=197179 RepID=UPI002958523F|nr:U3 small nucleolar RNA-associated protein 18 homolog [Cylas formicarius]